MATKNNIYVKVLNIFKDLIKGNVKEVEITLYEMRTLDFAHFECNNYADILRKFCKEHNIIQVKNLLNSSYIFKLGDDK